MPAHHYVSRFHLRGFCDPLALRSPDPWLWIGTIADGMVKRRAPKNVGTVPDLFGGPGGFSGSDVTLEQFLANEVEGPAARVLRKVEGGGRWSELPSELMRYLGWAAARSLPMQRLERRWANRYGVGADTTYAEPPPKGIMEMEARTRPVQLVSSTGDETRVASGDELDELIDVGWIPDMSERANFLEVAHMQAYYFQARWFPRLRWFTLRPPDGQYFIIGDRPVGWGVPDSLEAPPSCLRDPSAFLIAPLTRSLTLVGRNSQDPWEVRPAQINAILAAWSHDWIAGPTSAVVAQALRDRTALTVRTH